MSSILNSMAVSFLFCIPFTVYAQATLGQRHGMNFGTFSNLRYIDETGDLLGIEIKIVPQYETAYAIFQCAEGTPTEPVLVPVQLKGNHFRFTVPNGDRSCGSIFTGTITARGMTLIAKSGNLKDEGYDAGGFIPRRSSYWSR